MNGETASDLAADGVFATHNGRLVQIIQDRAEALARIREAEFADLARMARLIGF